jgi:hypothetical protein
MISRRRSIVPSAPRPQLSTVDAAEKLAKLADTVERLTWLVSEETRLLRRGAYDAAGQLDAAKSELSGKYLMEIDVVRANVDAVAAQPRDVLAGLETLHAQFRLALDENLAVLGTARSVAESLLRGVAEEVGSRAAPKTYDARGGTREARPTAAPITISRMS